jgi:MraZ protein
MLEKISSLSFNLKDSRDYIRNQLASAFEIDVDKQGRIQIPTQIMNKYGLSKEVTVIGVGDHFEVWNADKYAEYEKSVDESFENIAEHIQFDK